MRTRSITELRKLYPNTYAVVAAPSIFRGAESVVRYFCSEDRAQRWARRYGRAYPYGSAVIIYAPRYRPGRPKLVQDLDWRQSHAYRLWRYDRRGRIGPPLF